MTNRKFEVAVAGATGAVGREMIKVLEATNFPVKKISFLASYRSAGKKLKFKDEEIAVEELSEKWIAENSPDIVLMSAGGGTSKKFSPLFEKKKIYVIDNSSAWRMSQGVPLVVPEINPRTLSTDKYIIANPNCSTIQMVHALFPIHKISKIKRIVVTTFQAVSGAGQKAILELRNQTGKIAASNFEKIQLPPRQFSAFPHQIAFNCLPQIDVFLENGYTKEEIKMVNETKKILDPEIEVTATCVRVPVFRGHSEAVNIELKQEIKIEKIREALSKTENVKVIDDAKNLKYPMPIMAAEKYETFVGRIRQDPSRKNCYWLWIVSDNLLKGAALNAVQIAFKLAEIL
ncbi:MAG: aspartate-semialdehyde dehydrogenase [Elusimicrobia bacterium]|nr:aspartate-semialdehyde dehydrogenase [Elusimicrobiota bacterium]